MFIPCVTCIRDTRVYRFQLKYMDIIFLLIPHHGIYVYFDSHFFVWFPCYSGWKTWTNSSTLIKHHNTSIVWNSSIYLQTLKGGLFFSHGVSNQGLFCNAKVKRKVKLLARTILLSKKCSHKRPGGSDLCLWATGSGKGNQCQNLTGMKYKAVKLTNYK